MATKRSTKRMPDYAAELLQERLEAHAAEHWPACKGVSVRRRSPYVYVDAQGPEDEEPVPLCRLRYLGSMAEWEFAFFTWSREAYEPSFLANGSPVGSPEECFDAAACWMLAG